MSIYVNTAQLRTAATAYGTVASDAQDVAEEVAAGTKALAADVTDPAVDAAVSAALVAVLRGLQLAGGGMDYSRSQLAETADAYDSTDASSATRLSRTASGAH